MAAGAPSAHPSATSHLFVSQMLVAQRFKFVVMGGSKLRYRRARLDRFRLEMKLTEDDVPAASAADAGS